MRIIRVGFLTIMPLVGSILCLLEESTKFGFTIMTVWFMFIGFIVGLMLTRDN
jgi:hypothetical protein